MASGAFAQEEPKQPMSAQDRAAKELSMMKTDLTLTADQEAKIKPILSSYAEKEQQVRQENKENREAAQTKRKELRTQKDTDLKTILTPEQYQKLQDKRKEHANHGGDNGDDHHGGQGKSH